MADRIAVMNAGTDRADRHAAGDLRPAGEHVRRRLHRLAADEFLALRGRAATGDRAIKFRRRQRCRCRKFASDVPVGPLVLGVRPEHIRFSDVAPIRGRVFGAEYLGTTQIVTVETEQGPLKARLPSSRPVQVGETVGLAFRSDYLALFDAQTGSAIRDRDSHGGRRPWLMSSFAARQQALRPQSMRCAICRWPSIDGEFVVLLGPSGAGKTTTLRLITGLERPDAGRISINGRDVTRDPPGTRDIAFVFQQYSLYPHLTVYDNLAFPLRSPARRVPEANIRKRVEQTAELLHITGKLGNRATRLSGGEMQRVAIGRALVRDPAIYLMDEPLSSLDAKLRGRTASRTQADSGRAGRHDPVCDARSGRGHDHGVAHRRHQGWRAASARYAARNLRESGRSLCRQRLGTPQINFLPAGLIPEAAMPAGTEHRRHPHRTPADRGRRMAAGSIGRVAPHRASRRPKSRSPRISGPNAGDARRPASAAASRPGRRTATVEPLYFDAAGRRIAATIH